MKSRTKNRGLLYVRRSDDGQEASLSQQLEWARSAAKKLGVSFQGTNADIEQMQRDGLNHCADIFMDDAVSGGDLTRPGFQAFLAAAIEDRSVSHVFAFKRDRLGRPQSLLQMMSFEQQVISSGVTLVTHDRTYSPEELKDNEMSYLIGGLIEYQEHGRFSPRLGDRIVFVQQSMAAKGLSTGGRAPYGFRRALVDQNNSFVQWLADGENIRRAGHHVRFLPHDEEKLAVWCTILEWRENGISYKKIAAKLNQMGIPSPNAGHTRRDHGSKYHVPGKWHPNTVRDLCANPIITGIKEYGRRSEGRYRRVGADGPRELEEHDLRPDGQPKLLENPEEVRIKAASGGEALFDAARWQQLQKRQTSLSEVRRNNGRRSTNPDRYPLATRVIDLTENCGSVMHGTPYGKKLKYVCGRYTNSGYTECHHNTVETRQLTSMLIKALVELVDKAGGREAIRARLLERARAAATEQATAEEPLALRHLQKQLDALEENIATAQRRMTTEQDDTRYEAIAKTFDSLVDEKTSLTKQITALAVPPQPAVDALSPESQVDELIAMLDSLENLAETPDANQQIRDLVLRLGIYIGLDFEEGRWGKRKVRKLRRGVIAFGKDNLPIPIHGRNCTGLETNAARETCSRKNIHSAPACCREPAAEHGSNRGDGTVNSRGDRT
jgi:DNA invertase Pin-like site-specific DNA recombinase